MRKYLIFILLFGLNLAIRGQSWPDLSGMPESTSTVSLRYWFNDDATSIQTTTTLSGATTIDASALVEGVHVVHYQVVDNLGKVGIPASKLFIRICGALTASKLRYWFDDDITTVTTTTSIPSGATTIDASALAEGIHIVHYQVIDNRNVAGIPASKMFIKAGGALTAASLRYWFDDDATTAKTIAIPSGATTIDAGPLIAGEHTIHIQTIDNQGVVGIPFTKTFTKVGPIRLTLTANQDPASPSDYWLTFHNTTGNFEADASTTVYKAELNDAKTSLTLTETADKIVNASTAVIMKSSSEQVVMTKTDAASTDTNDNDLLGGTSVATSNVAYTLSAGADGTSPIGFYKFSGTTLDGDKAHLELPVSLSRGFISFGEDEKTSMDTKRLATDDETDAVWYSLDGRKLSGEPAKKGVYIRNGKKVIK
ncbi:MAG: hypothetical protein IJ159_06305 [Prevotella sp.]|nr:hypothetical protein [Prevotella sp.]